MTNRNIIEFIGNYGLFVLLLILFVWLGVPKIYKAVFPTAMSANGTVEVDLGGITTGEAVTYNGKPYVTSEVDDLDGIGKVWIILQATNNN